MTQQRWNQGCLYPLSPVLLLFPFLCPFPSLLSSSPFFFSIWDLLGGLSLGNITTWKSLERLVQTLYLVVGRMADFYCQPVRPYQFLTEENALRNKALHFLQFHPKDENDTQSFVWMINNCLFLDWPDLKKGEKSSSLKEMSCLVCRPWQTPNLSNCQLFSFEAMINKGKFLLGKKVYWHRKICLCQN